MGKCGTQGSVVKKVNLYLILALSSKKILMCYLLFEFVSYDSFAVRDGEGGGGVVEKSPRSYPKIATSRLNF